MPDLSVTIANGKIKLTSCIYNGSGPRSGSVAALQKIASSKSGAILSKSATLQPQPNGNPQPRTYHTPDSIASFNSEGLPNNGIEYYISYDNITEILNSCDDNSKPYIVSLSGKTLHDNLEMISKIATSPSLSKIAGIELNLACPNVIGKPIIAYDFDQLDDILKQVSNMIQNQYPNTLPPLGIKLPPYLDFQHFQQTATIINKYKDSIQYVVSINTIGNALIIDGTVTEAPIIRSNNGYAGLSGTAIKYTALSNVCKLRELLHPNIDIVGVGGISTGQDVFNMLLVGATACQIATTHWKEGSQCFDRILNELNIILEEKGYNSITTDVINKLKPWTKDGANKLREYNKSNNNEKDNKDTNTSKSSSIQHDLEQQLHFYKLLAAVLTGIIALLTAHCYGIKAVLPSE